ncbi:hypothetical protein BK671_06525 [Pseudomonas fluorescens]|uniref:Uncharacterized protein n=2 Tax=Pseudomonas fluorescens TaxID=294 RepID=A0A423LQZ2_PSEFL|nr:hypothetical protein BK671_06525 [Pseudomonas fluorescens]
MEKIIMSDTQQQIDSLSGGSSSVVMGSNVLSFLSGVSRQDQQFIKDSMRLAEYRADNLFNRKLEPARWFEFYSGVLWSVGWGLEHAPVIIADNDFSGAVLDVWAKSMSTLLSREKIKQMKETFQLLEYDVAGVEVFTDSTRKWGDFRFAPAQYNVHKELELVISNVRLINNEWVSTYLFWNITHGSAQLDIQSRRFVTKRREMDKYRDLLAAAVREFRVKEIELSLKS